ncbi:MULTISPECIES: palindromic element RPE3 domain-containing protein [unclassified Rickettsia]|uniref:palindromic element RPE3 domain-containing protein n=1 Tax=unclassified Rickettsia TaxID=114295 RepID=UPI003132E759
MQLNSERFRQGEFKDEPAERTEVCEHRRVLKNSLGSSDRDDAVAIPSKILLIFAKKYPII